jgi:hypothetical protein
MDDLSPSLVKKRNQMVFSSVSLAIGKAYTQPTGGIEYIKGKKDYAHTHFKQKP